MVTPPHTKLYQKNHTKPYQFWKYKVREVLDHRNDNTRSLPYQDTVHLTIDFGDCKKTEVLVLIGSFLKYWQYYYIKLGPLVDIKVAWSSKAKWYAGGKSAKFTNDEKHGRGGGLRVTFHYFIEPNYD